MIALIVAMAANRVIGRDNALPWHVPADLSHFKKLTLGKTVVMGRKTFQSIGRPLPNRHNIVVTRDPDWRADGVTVAHSLSEALARAVGEEIMVIGGAGLYAESLPFAGRIYLTEIEAAPEGDTHFPELGPDWREMARERHPGDPAYSFVLLERRAPIP